MLRQLLQVLRRCSTPVSIDDRLRTEPVSRQFGLDRGTPIDRHYIEQFLAGQCHLIRGRVLEVGESRYTQQFGADRVGASEVLHPQAGHAQATVVGDLGNPSALPERIVDCFICTQTLNFIFDAQAAVESAHRLLKPGGTLLATVAGISQISQYDSARWGDYWRFTPQSLERLLQPAFGSAIEVRSHGNLLAAKALLDGLAVEDLPDAGLLDKADPDYPVLLSIVATRTA